MHYCSLYQNNNNLFPYFDSRQQLNKRLILALTVLGYSVRNIIEEQYSAGRQMLSDKETAESKLSSWHLTLDNLERRVLSLPEKELPVKNNSRNNSQSTNQFNKPNQIVNTNINQITKVPLLSTSSTSRHSRPPTNSLSGFRSRGSTIRESNDISAQSTFRESLPSNSLHNTFNSVDFQRAKQNQAESNFMPPSSPTLSVKNVNIIDDPTVPNIPMQRDKTMVPNTVPLLPINKVNSQTKLGGSITGNNNNKLSRERKISLSKRYSGNSNDGPNYDRNLSPNGAQSPVDNVPTNQAISPVHSVSSFVPPPKIASPTIVPNISKPSSPIGSTIPNIPISNKNSGIHSPPILQQQQQQIPVHQQQGPKITDVPPPPSTFQPLNQAPPAGPGGFMMPGMDSNNDQTSHQNDAYDYFSQPQGQVISLGGPQSRRNSNSNSQTRVQSRPTSRDSVVNQEPAVTNNQASGDTNTTINSSNVNKSNTKSEPKVDSQPVQKKGFFSGLFQRKEVHLGNKNDFYYDEKLKKWIDPNAPEEEEEKIAPPPKMGGMAPVTAAAANNNNITNTQPGNVPMMMGSNNTSAPSGLPPPGGNNFRRPGRKNRGAGGPATIPPMMPGNMPTMFKPMANNNDTDQETKRPTF